MPVSEAQKRANKKYDDENFEYCTIKVKKGLKNRIKAVLKENEKVNTFGVEALTKEVEKREKAKD